MYLRVLSFTVIEAIHVQTVNVKQLRQKVLLIIR